MRTFATMAALAALGMSAALAQQPPLQGQPQGQPKGQPQGQPKGQPKGPPLGGPATMQMQAAAAGGPNCHQTAIATSRDGMSFTPDGQILERASVPDGVRLPGGGLGVYYVTGGDDHGIFLGRLVGSRWERGEKVLLDGAFDGNAVDPDAVNLPDGRIRLFYYRGAFVAGAVPSQMAPFYSAISTDGVRFTVEGKVFEIEGGTDPSAVQLPDGSWLLAVARAQAREMVIARSADGKVFERVATLANGGIPELNVLADGRVRIFFNGSGGAGTPPGMVSRISADGGRTWTDERGTRLNLQGFAADPSVVRLDNGQYRMFYKTADQACEQANRPAMPVGGPAGMPKGAPQTFGPGQQPLPPIPVGPGGVQGQPKGPLGQPKGPVAQ